MREWKNRATELWLRTLTYWFAYTSVLYLINNQLLPAGSYVMSNSGNLSKLKNATTAKPFRGYVLLMVERHVSHFRDIRDYCMPAKRREQTINARHLVFIGLRSTRTSVLTASWNTKRFQLRFKWPDLSVWHGTKVLCQICFMQSFSI